MTETDFQNIRSIFTLESAREYARQEPGATAHWESEGVFTMLASQGGETIMATGAGKGGSGSASGKASNAALQDTEDRFQKWAKSEKTKKPTDYNRWFPKSPPSPTGK